LLEVFDAPSIVTTCTRRLPSTIPLQSLSLMNSAFMIARAQKFAMRLERECAPAPGGMAERDARIGRAFLLTIGREPLPDEQGAARRFLQSQPLHYPGLAEPAARHRALVDFCQMMLASNAFLYVE
jgi:hypothetical protein